MTVRFAQRAATARASEVRELLKLTQRPEVISFAGGLPAPESFPLAGLKAAMDRVLGEQACRALQYSTTEGEPGLRSWIAERLSTVHGAWYVDYSHGVRLVSTTVVVDGQPRSIYDALQDSRLAPVLTREGVTRAAWELMHPRIPARRTASLAGSPAALD